MMLHKRLIWLLLLVMTLAGCDFRPMTETGNMSYVRVYLDEDLLNVTTGFYNPDFNHPEYRRPDIMRVALFDSSTGEMVSERYLRGQGDDERGHYYFGYILAEPGIYDLLAYNFGTEATDLREEYDYKGITAFTNEISPSMRSRLLSRADDGDLSTKAGESIRYDADHLFVARAEGLKVKYHQGLDTLRNTGGEAWFRASSVVKSYYLQIGLTGAQYLSSSSVLLTGMGREVRLSSGNYTDGGEATLFFETNKGKFSEYGTDHDCIYGTFGTFGRLPDADNQLTVSVEMVTTYGTRLEETIPIREEFLRENAILHQWIIIDKTIDIPTPPTPEPGGGGLNPTVGDYTDVNSDIEI